MAAPMLEDDLAPEMPAPDPSLILLANEIRAQQHALPPVPPAPRNPRFDPAAWRLAAPKRGSRLRSGTTTMVLAPIAAALSLAWVPVSGSTPPREAPRVEKKAQDIARALSTLQQARLQTAPAKPPAAAPEAPAERKEPPPAVTQAPALTPQAAAAAPPQLMASPAPAPQLTAPPAAPQKPRVATRSTTAVRAEPEMTAASARTLPPRVILTVFRKKDDWLEIGSTYAWGWVHASLVYPYDPSGRGPS